MILLLKVITCAIETDVVGTTLMISGDGGITRSDVLKKGDYSQITKIIISNGPTYVKSTSFEKMGSLKSIHFSKTIEYLEDSVFYQNNRLEEFTVDPESRFLFTDGSMLYSYNRTILYKGLSLSYNNIITFDPRLEKIVGRGLSSVKADVIIIPKNVSSLGWAILIDSVSNQIQFENDSKITNLRTHLYYYAHIKVIHISRSVCSISGNAFQRSNCEEILFDDIENSSCTTLLKMAFFSMPKLKKIFLPPKIASLPDECFKNTNIESVNIPKDCTDISSSAFSSCANLKTITIDQGNKKYKVSDSIIFNKEETQIIFAPPGITNFSISEHIEEIPKTLVQTLVKIDSINVSDKNNKFSGIHGCVYEKDFGTLLGVCGGVKNLLIHENTTKIGEMACIGVEIETVSFLGNKVKKILDSAFRNCMMLKGIDLIDSITELNSEAFYKSGLQSIDLRNVTQVGDKCFEQSDLRVIHISSSVSTMGISVFRSCANIESVIFDELLTISEITVQMFSYAGKIGSTFPIPKKIKIINTNAFYYSNFNFMIPSDSDLEVIGESAFEGSRLEGEVIIPPLVSVIKLRAFSYCTQLSSVSFNKQSNIATIENSVFKGCTSLMSFQVPHTISYLDPSVFYDCFKLDTVIGRNFDSFLCIEGNIIYNSNFTELMICPPGLLMASIRSSVESIASNAFYNCRMLTNVFFTPPSFVETLNENVFAKCTSLSMIILPQSVKNLSKSCFADCTSLSDVSFTQGSKLRILGESSFKGCINLKKVDFGNPSAFESIGDSAFEGCNNLTHIDLPPCLKYLGSNCFKGCSFVDITLESISSIGVGGFSECLSLKSAKLLSIKSIPNSLFEGCKSLNQIVLPSNIYPGFNIGEKAFASCGFVSMNIPNGIEILMNSSFEGNFDLESINISSSITKICDDCFNRCPALKTVIYCGKNIIEGSCGIEDKKVMIYVSEKYKYENFCKIYARRQLDELCSFLPPTPSHSEFFTGSDIGCHSVMLAELSDTLNE